MNDDLRDKVRGFLGSSLILFLKACYCSSKRATCLDGVSSGVTVANFVNFVLGHTQSTTVIHKIFSSSHTCKVS